MEYTIIELKQMESVVFDGFGPECEMQAFGKMKEWIDEHKLKKYRIFGYNINAEGMLTYEPQHEGYRVLLIPSENNVSFSGIKNEVIAPGKFLVIHSEGNLQDIDLWIPEAWMKLNRTVQEQKLEVKEPPRWYEEHIRSTIPDHLAVNLYLELQ